LDKDFEVLESTGDKTLRLVKLYKALLTIKPTSTICEQAFSVEDTSKK
jgi:hypothetical protein